MTAIELATMINYNINNNHKIKKHLKVIFILQ